ncbi:3-hydroxybutyrate oligomer hydrolase family protein [Luteibacter sp. 3190]|uniref:3-hydroxybutyrate oligomer hydrolase family protein n=1 Tax=Luteibacter sp. 3190 TaxID=2817736 RepID=UPI00285E1FAD|nr:3-hydroxybutyrate oligomer hydrolase family protein [Luteibacter sp. 3190]MDR6936119.1 hydroxybutyrate-dimer hydrolase [Luteibacter sp. 3190]
MSATDRFGDVRITEHRHGDDLLSAGLGLRGLAGTTTAFAQPASPTPAELRRRAIQASWKGIADLGPLGGFGTVYGGVPDVPGREFTAFATLPGAHAPHRVLVQVPDDFDRAKRCLVVTASSGSRGIYGPIALAGAWGLPRGCAVAYTDKGTGAGYFDPVDGSGVALDGTRAKAGTAPLEFEPKGLAPDAGIAVKHAHSGDNPEADWGRHVLQAARFGLAMLDRAFPAEAPFTAKNTRIIATGLSNGGGAVLRAAGDDEDGILAAVVALEPNIHVEGRGRPFYDYATEAALLLPCALAAPEFDGLPFARVAHAAPPAWAIRCASLRAHGRFVANTPAAQASEALAMLRASGWQDDALKVGASSTSLDLWRAVTAAYASAYLRRPADGMPCGFSYRAQHTAGVAAPADAVVRAAWWADGSGVPPGAGVLLAGGTDVSLDPTLPGNLCLRELWTGQGDEVRALHAGVAATAAALPRAGLPVFVVHGAQDGLIPVAFSSDPYVAWLRASGRSPVYWKVPYAQHFDAFLAFPDFGDRHAPLLPFGYAALDRAWAHLSEGRPLPEDAAVRDARPRGPGALTAAALGLPVR